MSIKNINFRHSNLNLKNLTILFSVLILTFSIVILATSCSQTQKVIPGQYPNLAVENAQIDPKYKDVAQNLSNDGIAEFMNNISKIPHPSGHVEQIREYLYNWGLQHNFDTKIDDSGCVYLDVPATSGYENYPNVILQAHMDMVMVNADKSADTTNTSIDLVYDKESGKIYSKDYQTSIGADDAEGIITLLSIATSKDVEHGPLRLVFTYDEETTMQGAKDINTDVLNADYIINIDNSNCGTLIYASAGSIKSTLSKNYNLTPINNKDLVSLQIENLKGGHSGVDIIKPRANAIIFERNILNKLKENEINFNLVEFNGGMVANSIPDSAELKILINDSDFQKLSELTEESKQNLLNEKKDDNNAVINISKTENANLNALDCESTNEILEVLNTYPNGVIKDDVNNKEIPIASNNLGVIKCKDGYIKIENQNRSSDEEYLKKLDADLNKIQAEKNYTYTIDSQYPAWPGSKDTQLLKLFQESYKKTGNVEANISSIHAGLECSFFHVKRPNAQVISIGADVAAEHSVFETFYTKSLPEHMASVIYVLENINNIQ